MPLCDCSASLSHLLWAAERWYGWRGTQFCCCCSQVAGRRATIAKSTEMKLNLGECIYFLFLHCCPCKQWNTFQVRGMRLWLVEHSSRVVCSQLLPTSVSAVVRSWLGLHRSWQCCSLKAQRWPELNVGGWREKKIVPGARFFAQPPKLAQSQHDRQTNKSWVCLHKKINEITDLLLKNHHIFFSLSK